MAAGLRHLPPAQRTLHQVRFIEISFCSNKSNRFAGRYNVDAQPNVWVGKIAHGSYDNWCDGHGLVRNI